MYYVDEKGLIYDKPVYNAKTYHTPFDASMKALDIISDRIKANNVEAEKIQSTVNAVREFGRNYTTVCKPPTYIGSSYVELYTGRRYGQSSNMPRNTVSLLLHLQKEAGNEMDAKRLQFYFEAASDSVGFNWTRIRDLGLMVSNLGLYSDEDIEKVCNEYFPFESDLPFCIE